MAEAFGIACHELVSLDRRCGSQAAVSNPLTVGPLSGVKPTKSGRKLTPAVESRLTAGKRTHSDPASHAC